MEDPRPDSALGVALASEPPLADEVIEEGAVEVDEVVASVAVEDDAEEIVEGTSELLVRRLFDVEGS